MVIKIAANENTIFTNFGMNLKISIKQILENFSKNLESYKNFGLINSTTTSTNSEHLIATFLGIFGEWNYLFL